MAFFAFTHEIHQEKQPWGFPGTPQEGLEGTWRAFWETSGRPTGRNHANAERPSRERPTGAPGAGQTRPRLIRNTAPRDQILPVSINWPTNYNFALFSKLPTNYTKISEKIQKTYVNAPRSGAFWYVKCIVSEIFL